MQIDRTRFGAKPIATAVLDASAPQASKIRLVQLGPSVSDRAFLQRGLDSFKAQARKNTSVIPVKPGESHENHLELGEEAFERSLSLLNALANGSLKQGPIVIAALDQSHQLMGLALGHIERALPSGEKLYSMLDDNLAEDLKGVDSNAGTSGHSSLNWLVSFSEQNGVGKALVSAFEAVLPSAVKRVDIVGETPEYSVRASKLYDRFGFKAKPELSQRKPVLQSPKADMSGVPTFEAMHGMPRSAQREAYKQAAETVRQAQAYTPVQGPELDLDAVGRLPEFKMPIPPGNSGS
ncbi:MAG: hypothetical protein VKJ06_05290 [Vampirovibrionales bacterium]|nr:hypothetical protein [Vampirovibrionales bacterium]